MIEREACAHVYRTNIQADVPTPIKGVIYSRDLLEGAIREYLDCHPLYGMLEFSDEAESFELDGERISHEVNNAFLDDAGQLYVEIVPLDTPTGRLINLFPKMLQPSVVAIGFCGWEEGSKAVEEAALIHVNLVLKEG